MADILKLSSYKILNSLPRKPKDGEIAFCEDEKKYYVFHEKWVPVEAKMKDQNLKLNLYDLNKQIISQLPNYSNKKIEELKEVIKIWKSSQEDKYFLLYGKEVGYFTLFTNINDNSYNSFEQEVIECLKDFNGIKDYDKNEKSIEIWVNIEGETTALYLFGFDAGVIEYNG